jgi:monofunctional biosynthetic peptidoglycan transglycosylase
MAFAAGARRWARRAALTALALLVGLQFWYLGWVLYWKWHNPIQTAFMQHDLERVEKSAAGSGPAAAAAARRPRVQQRIWVDYAHISTALKRAVIASEDGRFVSHEGVDWEAMQKAYRDNLRRGHTAHGGSTISQQLAKNLFLSSRRSYLRKFQELLITFMIEASWDKRRILEVYLNVVEWGDGVFGAEAGARHYYGVTAASLDQDQAARMAAMLPAPKFFDRHRDSTYLEQRSEVIQKTLPYALIP